MKRPKETIVEVAVARPVREPLSYTAPDELAHKAAVGCRVTVPLGRSRAPGYILGRGCAPGDHNLRPVLEVLDEGPLFHASAVPFFKWLSEYYLHPIGPLIESVLPVGGAERAFFGVRLTRHGEELVSSLPSRSEERRLLAWVSEHPGKRPPFQEKDLRELEQRGLLEREFRPRGRRGGGPRMQRFVRPREDADLDLFLDKRSGSLWTRNERAVLREIFDSGGLRLRELRARFENAGYLVDKWVGKGLLEKYDAPVIHAPAGEINFPVEAPETLYGQQESALGRIHGLLEKKAFEVCLLYGVTGSGKTEVYCRAAMEAVEQGRQVLVLVPEISLAVYMEGLFRSRFGEKVAVYHSGLSRGERTSQWVRMARGDVDVAVGARSALFAPLERLGLIIVDEEHDFSYKQEASPRYNARDAAVVRARLEKALVILGSGTPSIQSFRNAHTKKYRLISMPDRIEKRPLPEVEIVDVKEGGHLWGLEEVISPALRRALQDALSAGNQSILFLNRRGFHRVFLCSKCGEAVTCPNCDLALIHHFRDRILACHYCGFRTEPLRTCPGCGSREMRAFGFGTERLEAELGRFLPGARIARMDKDSTRLKGSAIKILKRFGSGEIDILVGTQMITKGYDFPNVTLVGVVAADASLGFPDFRAAERTYQLLCQVGGRAGRGESPGRVVVQTMNPSHYALVSARTNDYESFYAREVMLRESLGYPPFTYLALLRVQGNRKESAESAARRLGRGMKELKGGGPSDFSRIRILGPVEAPIARMKGKYRWHILLKSAGSEALHLYLRALEGPTDRIVKKFGVTVSTDIDPYQML